MTFATLGWVWPIVASDPTTDVAQWVQTGGVVGVLAFIVGGFMTGRLVAGKVADGKDIRIAALEQQIRDKDAEYVRVIERITGPLEQASQALRDSALGSRTIIEETRIPRNDVDVVLRRLESAIGELGDMVVSQKDREP